MCGITGAGIVVGIVVGVGVAADVEAATVVGNGAVVTGAEAVTVLLTFCFLILSDDFCSRDRFRFSPAVVVVASGVEIGVRSFFSFSAMLSLEIGLLLSCCCLSRRFSRSFSSLATN